MHVFNKRARITFQPYIYIQKSTKLLKHKCLLIYDIKYQINAHHKPPAKKLDAKYWYAVYPSISGPFFTARCLCTSTCDMEQLRFVQTCILGCFRSLCICFSIFYQLAAVKHLFTKAGNYFYQLIIPQSKV